MNRRQLLATLGTGIGGLAGCLTGTPGESTVTPVGDDTDDEPTASPTPTPDGGTEGVSNIVVRKAVRYESFLGSGGVLAADGRQYVVAKVETGTDQPDSEYVFEADGQTWGAGLPTTAGGNTRSVADRDWPVVGFEVPSPLPASNPQIRSDDSGDAWALGEAATTVLSEPGPSYELDALTAPENVSQGETMTVEITATNVSDTDGRFLAAVYWPTERIADDDESHIVDRTVPAGDTVTATLEIDTAYIASESGPITLSVEGHVAANRDVQVEDVDTGE